MLEKTQAAFVAALRDGSLPPPAGVVGRGDEAPVRRFSVYRNNVFVSLVEALLATYPVTARLVGDEFFRAMARVYAGEHLPRTPVLLNYGESVPAFVDRFEPASGLPYLGDVARLEWAWSRAYHAAEAEAVSLHAMAAVPEARAAGLVLELHPSLRIVSSRFPILDIWRANSGVGEVPHVDLRAGGVDVLVLRPREMVELRALPPGGGAFLGAIADGRSLGEAYERAVGSAPGFDLPGNLAALIGVGAVTGYRIAAAEAAMEPAS